MSAIDQLLDPIPLPRMVRVRQHFDRPVMADPVAVMVEKIESRGLLDSLNFDARIAVAVGSRGITNLPVLTKALVAKVRMAGGDPFIVPAMGSHGGATAEGQESMLREMGITPEFVGAPICSSMDVVRLGETDNGLPVYLDKNAAMADGIVFINRVKAHVSYRGSYESGLMKMITIGLGKQRGADICHELGFGTMAANVPAIARVALANAKFLFGVAVLENAYHETCRVEVLKPGEIEREEPALQTEAKRLSPRLFFDQLDVLIIDEIGKDVSGTGFDTNVVGRYHTQFISDPNGLKVTRISVLDITDRSHGNGNGLGIADFTTRRAFEKFNFEQTYPNALTTTVPLSVKIPMVLKNDRQAVQAAIKTCNIPDKKQVKAVRITNTLSVQDIEVSENLTGWALVHPNLEVNGSPYDLRFDSNNNLF